MRVLNKFSSLVVVGGVAIAAVLGGCSSSANSEESGSGAMSSSQSASISAEDISGTWELSAYSDGSQSLDKSGLASYGYSYTLTVKADGTLDLATLPGTWVATGTDTYTFTVDQATDSQSGSTADSQSGAQSSSGPVVFTVTYKNGELHLVTTGGIDWTFTRATDTTGQSGQSGTVDSTQSK